MQKKKILNAFDLVPPISKRGEVKPTIVKGTKGKLLSINGRLICSLAPNTSNPIGSLKSVGIEEAMTRAVRASHRERINQLTGNKLGYYKHRGGRSD